MAYAELKRNIEDVDQALREAGERIESLRGISSEQVVEQIEEIEGELDYISKSLIKGVSVSLSEFNLETQEKYAPWLDQVETKVASLKRELKDIESGAKRKMLHGDRVDEPVIDRAKMTDGEKITAATEINTQTIVLIRRMNGEVQQMITTNTQSLEGLEKNGEVLLEIQGKLGDMQTDLAMTKLVIKDFFRSLTSDRLTLVLIIVLVVAILGVIIAGIVSGVKG